MISLLFNKIKWIKKNLFEILVILSLIVIIVTSFFRWWKGGEGSWDEQYYYLPQINQKNKNNNNSNNTLQYSPSPKKDSAGELRTRAFLESHFKRPFSKCRPDFMINPVTGSRYNLEFDCYNSELGLAVEYNGAQHYNYIPFFHKNKEAFYNQKYRDELKRMRCKELGIVLIEIPYTKENQLESYLKEQLKMHGF
jgi:hypothetical protein